ncbi:glutaredoxin family protein [Paraconexibacter sp.]|uniref:glutaredoxin family protein n=1 Tax=Paraconexibacter sp. TaxID=2949640 RepID=UPI0035686B8E
MSTAEVTVHVREGCHLCEEALAVLRPLVAGHGARLAVVDIESDDALHRRYLERIPVISLDGEELYDFFVDQEDLGRRLRSRRMGGA